MSQLYSNCCTTQKCAKCIAGSTWNLFKERAQTAGVGRAYPHWAYTLGVGSRMFQKFVQEGQIPKNCLDQIMAEVNPDIRVVIQDGTEGRIWVTSSDVGSNSPCFPNRTRAAWVSKKEKERKKERRVK